MNRQEIDRLLGAYATGNLTEAEKKQLFEASLQDQEIFEALMAEDELREAIELPGARARLLRALEQEEASTPLLVAAAASVQPAPAPKRTAKAPQPRSTLWLAWAAGLGVVFTSGAISYMLLERHTDTSQQVAQVDLPSTQSSPPRPPARPFEPPPQRVSKINVKVPPPPDITAAAPKLPPVKVPLPLAASPPPPPLKKAEVAAAGPPPSESRAADAAAPAITETQAFAARKREQAESAPFQSNSPAATAPISASLWRKREDGVWVRVMPEEKVDRDATLAVRATPAFNMPVNLRNAAGRVIAVKPGTAGEELDFLVPKDLLASATTSEVFLSLSFSPARSNPIKPQTDAAPRLAVPGLKSPGLAGAAPSIGSQPRGPQAVQILIRLQ